jgi:hypothetical protein
MDKPGFDRIIKSVIKEFKSSKHAYRNMTIWWKMLKLAIQLEAKQFGKKQGCASEENHSNDSGISTSSGETAALEGS